MHAHRTFRWTTLLILALLVSPLIVSARPQPALMAGIDARVLAEAAAKDKTSFWVILRDKADLEPAKNIKDWKERGDFVVNQLKSVADRSQKELHKLLKSRGKEYTSFWIVNAIQVTADQETIMELAARPEVAEIASDEPQRMPQPIAGKEAAQVQATEWNIDRIRAPQVWSTFNVRGEGIVVASIDSGVQYTHPALVNQYRGRQPDGSFNHNYSWHDPSNVCDNSRSAPCDNTGHGTHTMGTIAGDDGAGNQIGVAPRIKWIAAKGCESSSCSNAALLSSGQWILAPTDLKGQNPRADLRPNIVNNSWGGRSGNTWYRATVQAWIAAGIFPVFSNGNNGPFCKTSGSPGDYPESYSVGASTINNGIAEFSSRGASTVTGGGIKPNIAAPGENVRSAWNNSGYNTISGTSMAAPHVAGTVALMWSAAPALIGDISRTRALLDQSAIDTSNVNCGGTVAKNNVWGEGKLDAFEAVSQSPRSAADTLRGTVTNASTGAALSGVTIQVAGPTTRITTTSSSGAYSLILPTGTYTLTVRAYGYVTQTISEVLVGSGITTRNIPLSPAPLTTVSGSVRTTSGAALANVAVTIANTPLAPARTDANGAYSFTGVPHGEYQIRAETIPCYTAQTQTLRVDAAKTLDFALTQRSDGTYLCEKAGFSYIEASTVLPLSGDNVVTQVTLPFTFTFYGKPYGSVYISTNGMLSFAGSNTSGVNTSIPSLNWPNGAIYPFWDDLNVDALASVRTQTIGASPNRQFVIEWRNVHMNIDPSRRMDFEVILSENGQILIQYRNIADDGREQGDSATVGIEDNPGSFGLQYSFNQPTLSNNLAIRYH
jgi:subtilisin family serine protease